MNTIKKLLLTTVMTITAISMTACATSSGLTQQQMDTVYQYNYQLTRDNGQSEKSAKTMADIGLKTFKMSAWANSENKELIDRKVERMQQALDKQKADNKPIESVFD